MASDKVCSVGTEPALSGISQRPPRLLYSVYALGIFFLLNVIILSDRQLLSVLAEEIKADLGLSDAEIGFAYGTGLAVFYSIFSIPIGRLADAWVRKYVLSISIAMSSVFIFMTGLARNFTFFTATRIGVGIGEAGVSPAAMSLISDYFPARYRSTALAVFTAGVPIGTGLGTILGGHISQSWNTLFPNVVDAPFQLRGWMVAFFCVAVLGPLIALWVLSLNEPARRRVDESKSALIKNTLDESISVLPIIGSMHLASVIGWKKVLYNNLYTIFILAVAAMLVALTGSLVQWVAVAIGSCCVLSWAQNLAVRDRQTFGQIFGSKTIQLSCFGLAGFIFVYTGVSAWVIPFAIRQFGIAPAEVGTAVGTIAVFVGCGGSILGGVICDVLDRFTIRGRPITIVGAAILTAPSIFCLINAQTIEVLYLSFAAFSLFSSSIFAIGPSIVNGLVKPHMRAVASAYYLIIVSLFGASLGPYTVGRISDAVQHAGLSGAVGLYWGLISCFAGLLVCLLLVGVVLFTIRADLERSVYA